MTVAAGFFYVLSAILVASALMVILARNPVHSVLFLILCFVNAAGLFLLAGAEFLAMILLIVYVGAVAVLFLFVVMMLDVDFAQFKQGLLRYLPLGAVVGVILLVELLTVVGGYVIDPEIMKMPIAPASADITNAESLGRVLYTQFILYFQLSGIILLVAMVGAIVLTLRHKKNIKRQNISDQVSRRREEAVEVVDVKSGEGI